MATMTLIQAVNDALKTEMRRDDRVVVLGEDVGKKGGVFLATEGLYDEFGADRVMDTPLAESGIIGTAIGMALYGLRPVAEIQFLDFIYPGFDQIVSEAAKMRYRSGGEWTCPMVIRSPSGGGIRGGHYHSQSSEAYFAHTPGLRVLMPSNARDAKVHPSAHLVEPKRIHLGARCEIHAGVVIDASGGPVLVGEGAVVLPNASVLGPVAIGAGSIVKAGARILSGTSIGRVCKVGGEVDETIIADYSNKQHDGFLGHSYLGSWVNIGAASNNSDLKNNYGAVRMWNAGRVRDTGRQFLGLVMGDHTKTGINAVFNTGTVVGFNCNLYSSEMPDTFVPSFSWGHGTAMVPYQLDKATQTAEAAMKRRGMVFTAAPRRLFERVHEISARSGRNA